MSGVNCGKGIVTAGQSQGAALAIMAKNYEPNVQATLGMSVSDTFQWLGLSLWCLDKQYTAIPSNRLMIVNGEDDFYYGGQLPVERVSGLSCPSGSSEWVPMGWHFREMSGVDQFVIDQDVTVNFGEEPRPWVEELLASMADTLAAHGGTAGILRDQAPPPLNGRVGNDALIVSSDNEMTA